VQHHNAMRSSYHKATIANGTAASCKNGKLKEGKHLWAEGTSVLIIDTSVICAQEEALIELPKHIPAVPYVKLRLLRSEVNLRLDLAKSDNDS
jgi:hypothetical protein